MSGKKRCKTCGRMFDPAEPGEMFCSSLCRATGNFVDGGGDTSKPLSEEQRKDLIRRGKTVPAMSRETKPRRIRNGGEKYPRVAMMFALPPERRWEIAKDFTPEEREYGKRAAKRQMMEERKIDMAIEWEGDEPSGRAAECLLGGSLGDSDDGSI